MKNYLIKNRFHLTVAILFTLGFLGSLFFRWEPGLVLAGNFSGSFLEMLTFLPAIFLLIGLVDAWVPKEVVSRHTGESSGWQSSLWMMLLATLQAGPLYGAFPVAYLMWKKGTSVRNIYIYIGAFTTMKLPMLGFEIGFLGLKFSILRTFLSIPVFISIAWIMDRYFRNNFQMNDGK